MPTVFTEDFQRRAETTERQNANLQSEIDMRLKLATGTPEEVLAAIEQRAQFIENRGGGHSKQAAFNVRLNAPKPDKIENFHTLKTELGPDYDFTPQLEAILQSIDSDFPELDNEDRLFLKRDILNIFTPPKQRGFCDDERRLGETLDNIFTPHYSGSSQLGGTFARKSQSESYYAVVSVNPGTSHAHSELGEVSANAGQLYRDIKKLHGSVIGASDKYHDLIEERREADRAARRRDGRQPSNI